MLLMIVEIMIENAKMLTKHWRNLNFKKPTEEIPVIRRQLKMTGYGCLLTNLPTSKFDSNLTDAI